ncbi:MAG: Flp pilus assembly complex ATPase component TadA [Candidatus Delongbacteria bacterium]|nr:Flp pilus assembly complex ATPase component TadA [Candidatus Delongbacteria bacterium]
MLNYEILDKDEELIKLVDEILEKAVKENASDIHIEPKKTYTQVRYRVNGVLHIPEGYDKIPKKLHEYIIARIKILSKTIKLDVTLLPQDGVIRMKIEGIDVKFNLLLIPTIYGESLNIVVHRDDDDKLSIEEIFNKDKYLIDKFNKNISKSEGMILFTGLAGSGKMTILNSAIDQISDVGKKIVTIENIVDVVLNNTSQLQVHDKIGRTSEHLLRVALRADADILYISEFRDYDTAHVAFEGSMQGRLIFSTMHTNNAIDALFRCTHMGIKEYLPGSVLQFILNSKLAKTICKHCKEEKKYSKTSLKAVGLTDVEIKSNKFYKGKGCKKCDNTGYKGRVAIMEMLEFTTDLREAFINGADNKQITKLAKKEGVYYTHKDDAIKKLKGGFIDLDTARMFTL